MMELKFQRNLDFQLDAIKSTVDIFESQKFAHETFFVISENGIIPNTLNLTQDQILANINKIQKNNNIEPIQKLDGMNFSIEMETGTGKTYVYLRTIFELYQNYGFKKFIVIVPSVAIREGVLKNLKITEKHLKAIYENTPYSYYEYDSNKPNIIRQFARSNKIEIMIMTIDSFNKDTNIMNRQRDNLHGEKPIDLVNKTHPILLLDEPQNMESDIAKQAISNLNPLFTLRYSATHRNYYNLIYRLTPIDAYQKDLVKKIEVMSVVKDGDFNTAFIRCIEIKAEKKGIKTKLLLNKKLTNGYKATEIILKDGEDLAKKTQNFEYDGFIVTEINAKHNFVKFSNGIRIRLGEEQGGNRQELMRVQIEQTVQEHFEKSKLLKPLGIKPLSLFFIDRVDNYLAEDGFIRKSFENSFEKLKKEYKEFTKMNAKHVHSGYFSKLKTEKGMQQDKDTFDLIMKDKERLLSFDEPVQFIFSHSALREGWDNPNVFNICTLNQTISGIKKRQEIGRGMRLPVNQEGDRLYGDQNILTVIANENYANYASKLQTEYEEEYGLGGSPDIHDRKKRISLKLKKGFQLNPEFKELWKRVSKKTKYAVKLDTEKLIDSCVSEIESNVSVDSITINITTASLSLSGNKSQYEVKTDVQGTGRAQIENDFSIPNLIEQLSNETKLTRSTIVNILTKIDNLSLVFQNPQSFMLSISSIIKEKLEDFLVDGIKYLEVEDWYKMELFKDILTYEDAIVPVGSSIYNGIIWDSEIEKTFANKLNGMSNVKLFIKLPNWFIIDTPIGNYNPDWAIVMDDIDLRGNSRQKLYFVTETKGTTNLDDLRPDEKKKILCAKKHFKEINVKYDVVTNTDELLSKFS
jgi:type III restriction enzyme